MVPSDIRGVYSSSALCYASQGQIYLKVQHNKYHITQVAMQIITGSPNHRLNTAFSPEGVVLNVAKIIIARHSLKL